MFKVALRAAVARLISERPPTPKDGPPDPPAWVKQPGRDLPLRRWCASELGRRGDEQSVAALIALLEDAQESRPLRRWCAQVLGSLPPPDKVLTALSKCAENAAIPRQVRGACALALGATRAPLARDKLIQLLKEKNVDAFVRWEAARALAEFRDDSVVCEALISQIIADSTPSRVREECAVTLFAVDRGVAEGTLLNELATATDTGKVLSLLRAGLSAELIEAYIQANWVRCRPSASELELQLCALRQAKVPPAVIQAFQHASMAAPIDANDAVHMYEQSGSLEEFITTIEANGLLRRPTRKELNRLRDADIPGNVIDAVKAAKVANRKQAPPTRRATAARALGLLGGQAIGPLLVCRLNDRKENESVREACGEALARSADEGCRDALIQILVDTTQKDSVRAACAGGLGVIGCAVSRAALVEAVNDHNFPVKLREACAKALGRIDDDASRVQVEVIGDASQPEQPGHPSDEAIVIRQIEIFLASQFLYQRHDGAPGGLRMLLRQWYPDHEIDYWLKAEPRQTDKDGTDTTNGAADNFANDAGHFWPEVSNLALLCFGHIIKETCDCPAPHEHRRDDYYAKKCCRCATRHTLNRLPEDSLRDEPDLFIWRAVLGGRHPLQEPRAFVDSMLFPIMETPEHRALTWERHGKKTIILEADKAHALPANVDNQPAPGRTSSVLTLYCPSCGSFVGGDRNRDTCREKKHIWKLKRIELSDDELQGDINERFEDVCISACRHGHVWHPEGPTRCPQCHGPRRRGKDYKSIRVYVPISDDLIDG